VDDSQLHAAASALADSGVTSEQLTELLRASRETEPPALQPEPTPTPTPTPTGETSESDPLARAQAALDAQAQRQTLADGAKAILQERGLDLAWSEYSPDELIHLAGLGDKPNESRAEKLHRERLERDAALASDPAALRDELHRREVQDFTRRYWQLSPTERADRVAELGLNDFTPPESFNGLN
jgi:hypothetical protein